MATLLCLILVAAFGSPASGATRTIQPSSVDAHIVEDSANGNNGLRAQRPASGRPDQISRVFSEPDTAEFPAGEHFR